MSDKGVSTDQVSTTKVKIQRQTIPRLSKKRQERYLEKNVIEEPTLVKPLEEPVGNQITFPKKENNNKKVQQNNLMKCLEKMTISCASTASDSTLANMVKQNTRKTDVKSNFSSSHQEKSRNPKGKEKTQSEKGNSNDKSKRKIRERIKKNKDKSILTKKENLLINDSTVSLDTSHGKKKESCDKKSVKSANTKKYKEEFSEYIPVPRMKNILKSQTPSDSQYFESYIRINSMYYKHAYVKMSNEEDLLIVGIRDRNRALEGDLVVASLNEKDKWQTDTKGKQQKTGTVVCILEKIHPRKAIGTLKKIGTTVLLQPRDKRIPLIKIYPESLPALYNKTPTLFDKVLFLAGIKSWNKPQSALGKIEHMIGTLGDIEVELNAIILENGINTQPFNEELLKEIPSANERFTSKDIKEREDWRHHCVFTIDPATAVDLDDAVSCKVLTNGNYEVGVHIADVTHYLKFLSPLDKEVAKRATTVYLAHQTYHMLPYELCQMCSLLPGQDKLAFSVIWELTPDAEIVKHRFAKTIINSCCQMAYEQAQMIIENPECFSNDTFKIEGNFTPTDLGEVVNNLFKLSEKIRMRRYADGALKLDQPKLQILIDKESGLPFSYNIAEQKDSNRLIEEFMLLANMTVATHLYNMIPEYALLRNHGNPSQRLLSMAKDILQRFGIYLDIESSGDLCTSIKRYELYTESQSEKCRYLTKCRSMVINKLCARAMVVSSLRRATYNCSSEVKSTEKLRHYALNVPFYTHFTSPIRRYPDMVVHRLLHSTLSTKVKLPPNWNSKLCVQIANNCNSRKYSAKVAEEQTNELYFTYLIDIMGERIVAAIVFDVKEHSIDAILCETGIKIRVYLKEIENETTINYSNEYSVPTLTVTWKISNVTQVITVFTIVHLRIEKDTDLFQLNGVLLEPYQTHSH